MKKGSTLLLRGVILLIAIIVIVFCSFAFYTVTSDDQVGPYTAIILGVIVSTIPFFAALYRGFKLLNYIDQNKAFSDLSVNALNSIKYCAVIICGMYIAGSPFIFMVAERDDAPGVGAIALIIIFASGVVATFAAVLQRLLEQAIAIKSENELTV